MPSGRQARGRGRPAQAQARADAGKTASYKVASPLVTSTHNSHHDLLAIGNNRNKGSPHPSELVQHN
jgi:hypothetical protein